MITCAFENGNHALPGLRHITCSNIIIKDGKILLGLRKDIPGRNMLEVGKWGLIGGFMDRDETLERCVAREVMEESGWQVAHIQLLRINDSPSRPMEDRQNVDFIFIAEATVQTGSHDNEMKELRWFDLDVLPADTEIAFDHADSIKLYKLHLKSPQILPIIG